MITIEEAVNIVNTQNRDSRIVAGMESDELYLFRLVGRSVEINSVKELPIGAAMISVDKVSGILGWGSMAEYLSKAEPIDIAEHLDEEDVKVYKKVNSLFREMS